MVKRRIPRSPPGPVAETGAPFGADVLLTRGTGVLLDVGQPATPLAGSGADGGQVVVGPDFEVDDLYFRSAAGDFDKTIDDTVDIQTTGGTQGSFLPRCMLVGNLCGAGYAIEWLTVWTPDDAGDAAYDPPTWRHHEFLTVVTLNWFAQPPASPPVIFKPGTLAITCSLLGVTYGPRYVNLELV